MYPQDELTVIKQGARATSDYIQSPPEHAMLSELSLRHFAEGWGELNLGTPRAQSPTGGGRARRVQARDGK